jgi:hypothetical protein
VRWNPLARGGSHDHKARRPVIPERRLVETPRGMLTIEPGWFKPSGLSAGLTLYGPDGWNIDKRYWTERYGTAPDQEPKRLTQLISEWTEMPHAEAETLVDETFAQWRDSPAYEEQLKLQRNTYRAIGVMLGIAVLALAGVAALIWLLVSALT